MGKRDETSAALSLRTIGSATGCAIGCVLLGGLSAQLSPRTVWYETLRKPDWMPPGWLFGGVWTVLYAMMGAALGLILARGWRVGVGRAATLFGIQLLLNLAWSPIFFDLHSVGGALILIIVLWLMIGWTIAAFWSVRDIAGALLMPYWLWVTFAAALNAAIWRLNG